MKLWEDLRDKEWKIESEEYTEWEWKRKWKREWDKVKHQRDAKSNKNETEKKVWKRQGVRKTEWERMSDRPREKFEYKKIVFLPSAPNVGLNCLCSLKFLNTLIVAPSSLTA